MSFDDLPSEQEQPHGAALKPEWQKILQLHMAGWSTSRIAASVQHEDGEPYTERGVRGIIHEGLPRFFELDSKDLQVNPNDLKAFGRVYFADLDHRPSVLQLALKEGALREALKGITDRCMS